MIDISVVIVNYNVKDYLEQTLRSLRRAVTGISTEIFVVDNNSTDGSEKLFESDFSEVRFLRNRDNVGFARANNQALKMARGRFVLLLNPDTIVQEDTLRAMMAFMADHPNAGVIGCKILNADGSLQLACRRSFPTPGVALFKLVGLSRLFPKSRLFGRYNLTYLDPDRIHEVDAISGAFMFLRREVIERVGLLDEDFFMFGEDLDWCYRIQEHGWKIYYVPTTQIIHYKGQSIRRSGINSLIMFYKAMYIFMRKHVKRRYLLPLEWFITLGIVLKACFTLVSRLLGKAAVPVVDLLVVNVAVTLAIILRFGSLIPLPPHNTIQSYIIIHGVCSAIWLLSFVVMGLYGRNTYSVSRAFTAAIVGSLVVGFVYLFQFEAYGFSRRALAYASMLTALLMPGWRILFRLLSNRSLGRAMVRKRAVVVGADEIGKTLLDRLRRHPEVGYDVVGLVNGSRARVGETVEGVEILGTVEDLPQIIRSKGVEEVVLSTESMPYRQTLHLISSLRDPKVHVKLAPSPLEVMIGRQSIESLESVPLVEISGVSLSRWRRLTKRSFDVVIGGMGLVLFSPMLLLQVFLVKGSPKRYCFRLEEREGDAGTVLRLREFAESRSGRNTGSSLYRLMKRFGFYRILWLWPVMRGTMSVVGSPLPISSHERSPQALREGMKPGLTGLVQLERSVRFNAEERLKYELYYLRNQSLLLDGEILLKSLWHRISPSKGIRT